MTVSILSSLIVASVIAHDPHRMLTQPLWRDENWVAVSLRAPLDQVFKLTATTPVLFTVLVRFTPHTSPQTLRVLPLAFTVAAIIPAWMLGREIERSTRLTRLVLSAGVAFAPALLARHDLKQYTAEAFDALVLMWLLARLERQWSRRRLVVLGCALALSTLISNAAVFLGLAMLACLAIVLALRRDVSKLRELAVVGGLTLAADLVLFVTVDLPGDTPSLRAYWDAFYIPSDHGFAAAVHFVHFQAGAELQSVGMGPSLLVFGLVVAGMVTLARLGFPALALVIPATTVEQMAASGTHLYPLWDSRTSTWYTVVLTVMALLGVLGLARLVVHSVQSYWGPSKPIARWAGAAVVVALLAALSVPVVRAERVAIDTTTPLEDVQGQVATIMAQRHPGDVVVANVDAGFGLGVYWPAQPELVQADARLNTFRIAYPASDRVVVAKTISTAAEVEAVRRAVAMAAAVPGARVWAVFSHWHPAEGRTMIATLQQYGTLSTPPGQHGLEPVLLLTLRPGVA